MLKNCIHFGFKLHVKMGIQSNSFQNYLLPLFWVEFLIQTEIGVPTLAKKITKQRRSLTKFVASSQTSSPLAFSLQIKTYQNMLTTTDH